MSQRLQTQTTSHLLKLTIMQSDEMVFYKFVNADFFPTSLSAMKRCSLIVNTTWFTVFIGKWFQDLNLRIPINQMLFPLLHDNIHLVTKGSTQNLGIEEHNASWLATMFSLYGHKRLCLYRGPVW